MSGIERSVAEAVEALPPAKPGKSVTLDDVRPLVEASVAEAVKALPPPKDGTSVTIEQVQPLVDAAVAAIPPAEPGKSVTLDDVRPVVAEAVKAAVEALPKPQDGKSVTVADLQPTVAAAVAEAVKSLPPAEPGKDGVGLAGAMIDRDGVLQITTTAGTVVPLGKVVGTDGKSFDSFAMEYLSETHEVRIKAACAGREQELRFDAGGIRLAQESNGYWREGVKVKALEAVSYDGCLWVARTATTAKPGSDSKDWVLAARQGRPGANGKDLTAPRAPETIKVGT